jgi:hypothetical protein
MRTAVDDGLIQASPCVIRGAATSKRQIKIRPASLPELAALVEAMPDNLRLAVHLAAWCALRYGEIAELRRTDIDLRNGVIHVRRAVAWVNGTPGVGLPKLSAGPHDVAIPPPVLPTREAHLDSSSSVGREGLLFTNTVGKHWPPRRSTRRGGPPMVSQASGSAVPRSEAHRGGLAAQTGATLAELMNQLGHPVPRWRCGSGTWRKAGQQIAEALSGNSRKAGRREPFAPSADEGREAKRLGQQRQTAAMGAADRCVGCDSLLATVTWIEGRPLAAAQEQGDRFTAPSPSLSVPGR